MGYLQLAENYDYLQEDDYSQLADNSNSQVMANYIFIPGGLLPNTPEDKYVRLDFFDDLPDAEFLAIMQKLLPYQKNTLSDSVVSNLLGMVPVVGGVLKGSTNLAVGLIKGRKERKQAKAEAKKSGTEVPKKGIFGGLFKKKGKNIKTLPKAISTAIEQTEQQSATNTEMQRSSVGLPPFDISTTIDGQDYSISTQQDDKTQNFFQRYKTPLIIGGGILALGTIYLMTRKKK
jgi:hypothetical protein